MTEIDWRTVKLYDLCKARVRILMKECSILPALIKVLDGGWFFTISVAVVEVEEERRGREMGESTRRDYESHSWTGGRRLVEKAKSTGKGWSSNVVADRLKDGVESQKAEDASEGTHGKRSADVGNSCSQPSSPFNLNSNKERIGSFGPEGLRPTQVLRTSTKPLMQCKREGPILLKNLGHWWKQIWARREVLN